MRFPTGRTVRLIGALALLFVAGAMTPAHGEGKRGRALVAYAAASLQNSITEIARLLRRAEGIEVEFVYASSGALARRVAAGAPADAFLSANSEWMDYLEKKGHLAPGTRRAFALNSLVCVVPAKGRARLKRPEDLLGASRIGLGDPAHVPAGRYAREALRRLGLWDRLREAGRLVFAPDVRAALAFAERGAVDASIVYGSDARQTKRVRTAFAFPEGTHAPVAYFAGAVAGRERAAKAFLDFLGSAPAREILRRQGFGLPGGHRAE